MSTVSIVALEGIASVAPGDSIADHIVAALGRNDLVLEAGDILVLAQKIISKAENRYRRLDETKPTEEARKLAAQTEKDPRLVQLILEESSGVVRACPGVLITRHRLGFVMANAGIDASNIEGGEESVLLLPEDSDRSAARLRDELGLKLNVRPGIVIADSFGRPWRQGVTNIAIGVAGVPALLDRREHRDRGGRPLRVTQVAVGDLLASAAGLLLGEADENIPAVVLKGLPATYHCNPENRPRATDLVRPMETDLFS